MSKLNCKNQTVFIGDNLPIMRGLNSGCADLICADPPFNKKKRFNHSFGTPQSKKKPGFDDYWTMDDVREEEHELLHECYPKLYHLCAAARNMHSPEMQAYLVMMAVRLIECHRLLAETGSLYLHCDPTANAYLRLLLDGIFGQHNFRNEIIWQRSSRSDGKKFGAVADCILFFSKSEKYTWNDQFAPQNMIDTRHDLTGAGTSQGESGKPWRGYDPGDISRHWAAPLTGRFAEWVEKHRIPGYRQIASIHARLDALEKAGLIHWSRNKTPSVIHPAASKLGAKINSIWTDIPFARGNERSGWATQKPLALYSRMVLGSSNPGDVVLDPFCGCATTLVAAENAGRKWIGIDREQEAATQVLVQLAKLNENSYDFWRDRIIIRHDLPTREDLGDLPHYRTHFSDLYTEQNGICKLCLEQYDSHVMEVDHIVARSKGGQSDKQHLQLLCTRCNKLKGNLSMAQAIVKAKKLGIRKND